jgi:hypothetical protein
MAVSHDVIWQVNLHSQMPETNVRMRVCILGDDERRASSWEHESITPHYLTVVRPGYGSAHSDTVLVPLAWSGRRCFPVGKRQAPDTLGVMNLAGASGRRPTAVVHQRALIGVCKRRRQSGHWT